MCIQGSQQNLHQPQPQDYFHGITLGIAWLGFQHLGIWSLYLRNTYRYAVKFHALSMIMLTILTALGTATMITYQGLDVIVKNIYHTLYGFILVCLIPVAIVLGVLYKQKQESPNSTPKTVDKFKLIHVIFGWALIAATRVPLYDQTSRRFPYTFLICILFDIGSHLLYFYKKSTQIRMESISNIRINSKLINIMPQIRYNTDLDYYKGDYFIFADFVYKIGALLTTHPGGYQLIDKIRGRQVDRFIYGMEPLETVDLMDRVSHTAASLDLVGEPIGKIESSSIYPNIQQKTDCQISTVMFYQGSKKIYTIYLTPLNKKYEQFYYTGYTDISQLGKYFAVTAHKSKTKLYTMVNFLQRKSVRLMERITKGQIFNQQQKKLLDENLISFREGDHYKSILDWSEIYDQNKHKNNHIYQEVNIVSSLMQNSYHMQQHLKQNYEQKIQRNSIPLLIKKYQDGQFTPVLLKTKFCSQIQISKPRGRGLALQDLAHSNSKITHNIILFSGGTGIYPYADFIDLLFKQFLIEQDSSYKQSILKHDSVLEQKLFQNIKPTFYISVVMVEQMHPITLFQLQYLAFHDRIKVFLKSKREGDHEKINRRYPHIQILIERFQKTLQKISQKQISMIYICGPTRMTRVMIEKLQQLRWSPKKYLIV